MPNNLTIRVAGEGGEGVISVGEMLTLALARTHHDVFTFRTYPAEIKGGPAMLQVRCGNHPVLSQGSGLDVLVAFNDEAMHLHSRDLKSDGLLIYDSDVVQVNGQGEWEKYPVPMTNMASVEAGVKRAKNVAALAIMTRLFDVPKDTVERLVKERFSHKGDTVVDSNLKAVAAGYRYVENHPAAKELVVPPSIRKEQKVVMSGNEAMGISAIFAGCRYYAGYPITPASDLLEFMAQELPRFNGTCLQTEDEIAAITSCIGASFAGVKAMTATSGPGFSLMMEALGLASMTEIPLVIVDAQRAGPSTGMPTKTEQSDLMTAIYGGHGEAPRVVLAPANVKDCFYGMVKAFNLAEKYQIPVIMLSDQSLSHRTQTYTRPALGMLEVVNRIKTGPNRRGEDGKYLRFQFSETGVSPMAIPGTTGVSYVATGLEHDEAGVPNYSPSNHFRMSAKRHKKLELIAKEKGFTRRFGDEQARVGIISWGSTEGSIEEAIGKAHLLGYEVSALQLKMLHPLPDDEIRAFLSQVKQVIVPELNYTGQLAQLLRARYLIPTIQLNKCAGLPFAPEEILNKLEEVMKRA
ncbi:MAG: 2-oxoacid:acceptor oxidoreductase subunit alpha [Elusimicrobia bacterium]|nr:2-oxoacid:acceptor oxidoreductase subunit alpha [Elusimicrobiota bacterium]